MPRGGVRPNAGRKAGTANKRTREIADQVALTGSTPLEVMLSAMEAAREAGDARGAAFYAQMAAPYVHPRLSAVQASVDGNVRAQIQIVSEFEQ